jgi:hypothetical protein
MEAKLFKAARGLAVCAVVIVLAVAFAAMWFAHPLTDDLVRWREGLSGDWLSAVRFYYLQWTGRWSAMALDLALLPWLAGHLYGAALAVMALVQLAACFAFVRLALRQCISARCALGLAACLFALHWSGMPSPGESFYWVTGGTEYQLSISLATILIWLAACFRPERRLLRCGWIAALTLLAIFTTGLHELIALMLALVLTIAAWIAYRIRSGTFPTWCWLLAIAIAGLLISLLAPGNAARATSFVHGKEPLRAVGLTAKFLLRDLPTWIADPKLLGATLFLFLSPWFARLRPGWLAWEGIAWSRLIPAAGLCCIVLGAAAPTYATGSSPPDRVGNLLHFVFLIAWFATLLTATRWPDNWIMQRDPPAPLLQTAALASLGLALLTTGNSNLGLRDFDKRITRWDAAMQERERLAASTAPGSTLVLPAAPPIPNLFMQADLQPDPSDWRNQVFARFHGLGSVRLETELDRLERQARRAETRSPAPPR